MKCPRCGADSSVIDTRPFEFNQTIRKRECFNTHKFQTIEIHKACYGTTKPRARIYAATIARAIKLWLRNKDIARYMHLGHEFFMKKYKVSRTTVYNAARSGRRGIPYTMASKVKAIIQTEVKTNWVKH